MQTLSARYAKEDKEALIDQSDLGLNPRMLTPCERARLQGFPEVFVWHHLSRFQTYKQIGSAVPVSVVEAIARTLTKAVNF